MKSSCDLCSFEKAVRSKSVVRESQQNEKQFFSQNIEKGVDVLFLTDCVEYSENFIKICKFIQNLGVSSFVATSAIGCRGQGYAVGTPQYAVYNYCKSFDIHHYNPKVVVCFGRALNYFTKTDVFDGYRDFREHIFNDTYFYPHIESSWKGRIYPVGYLSNIFDFTSFENFHFKFQIQQVLQHIKNYKQEKFVMPSYEIKIIQNIDVFMEEHAHHNSVAIDTETNSLNMFIDNFQVGCIQMSFDGKVGYVLPIKIINNKRKFSSWLNHFEQYWANGKYDAKSLNRIKISGHRVDEDVPLLYHVLNTERNSNSLKVLSWFLGFGGYEDALDEYKTKYKIKNYLDIPERILHPYAGIDAIVTFLLMEKAKKDLIPRQPELYRIYKEIIIPVIPVFQAVEEEGLTVDKEYIQFYHAKLQVKLKAIEQEIYQLSGREFTISSNDDLGRVLEEMQLPDLGRTQKGLYKTGEELLTQWSQGGYTIADKLLLYRKYSKLDHTYVGENLSEENQACSFCFSGEKIKNEKEKGIYQYITPDGRVHGSIMPALTDSLRSLSLRPNLQNMPKQGLEGRAFRKVFIPPTEDYLICETDYAGFQLRLMAIYSNDQNMIKAFNTIKDLHSVTGCNIFAQGTDLKYFMEHKHEEPYKTARYNGKETNLAFAFGQTPYSYQSKIRDEWTEEQIDKYIQENKLSLIVERRTGEPNKYLTVSTGINSKYFETYPGLKRYAEYRHALAQKQGYVHCPIYPGAIRHLPELAHMSTELSKEKASYYGTLKNIAVNAEAQAGEALSVYQALVKIQNGIRKNNFKSRLIGCVHDSIVSYVHKSEIEQMYYLLKQSMERFDLSVPIVCEVEMGRIWGFGKEVTEKNMAEFIESVGKGECD
jgi:DNA polymerase-1